MSAIYGQRAELYDRIYHWKDYAGEAARVRALLQAEGVPDAARLLDAACGTGSHLQHLQRWYEVAGFDGSQEMLAVARRKLTGVPLWQSDLRALGVERPFQAVVCLFSSIGYLQGEAALREGARALAGALAPGGVLLVEPWFTPQQWQAGRPHLSHYSSPELCLARATVAEREGDLSINVMHWLVAAEGRPVEHWTERHALWLCPHETLLRAFQEAGLRARLEPEGLMPDRGLLVARRPA